MDYCISMTSAGNLNFDQNYYFYTLTSGPRSMDWVHGTTLVYGGPGAWHIVALPHKLAALAVIRLIELRWRARGHHMARDGGGAHGDQGSQRMAARRWSAGAHQKKGEAASLSTSRRRLEEDEGGHQR